MDSTGVEIEGRRGAAPSLLGFVRSRAGRILQAWIERARANGLAIERPEDVLENLLSLIAARLGESSFWSTDAHRTTIGLGPAELRQDFGLLRSCILELWAKEVGPVVPVVELQQLEQAQEHLVQEASRRRTRVGEALEELASTSNGNGDLDAFLKVLVGSIQDLGDAFESVGIWLNEGVELRLAGMAGLTPEQLAAIAHDQDLLRAAISEKRPKELSRIERQRSAALEPSGDLLAAYAVPLVHRGTVIGVIQVGSMRPTRFSDSDKLVLQAAATVVTGRIVQSWLASASPSPLGEHELWMAEDSELTRRDLLNIVSHDLRSPLGAILLSANAIAGASEADDPHADRRRRQCDIIVRAAKHMNRLVNDLLDLSKTAGNRLLSIEKSPGDAVDLSRQAVETFGPLAEARGITLSFETDGSSCRLLCDSDRLKQILSNLLGNAIKFTEAGGAVTLRVGTRHDEEVIFSVVDTGVGISADQLPRIFEPYLQGRGAHQGLGLGLSVARALVRAHGGRIWAESTLGQGSTFFFALPALQPTDAADWQVQPPLAFSQEKDT